MKQGLHERDHATMLVLIEQGKTVDEISVWLNVTPSYIEPHIPKKPEPEPEAAPEPAPKKKAQPRKKTARARTPKNGD